MKRIKKLLAAAAAAAVAVSGSVIPAAAEDDSYDVISLAITGDPTFTFEAIGDTLGITVGLLRESLTRYGDGVIADGLAESYEHNEDYTQWTFHLRESGWSDGTPVTADDWVFAITSMLNGDADLSYPDFLYEIKNARGVFDHTVSEEELGVTAVDEKTLVFELEYPVTYYPQLVTHPMHFGYSRAFAEEVGIDQVGLEADTFISNGPYYIDSWEHDDKLVLKKNEYYWNADNIAIDEVDVYIIPDESTQVSMFLNGELDVIDFSAAREATITSAGYDALTYNNGRTVYIQYNMDSAGVSNQKIRQAISCAIDREAIVNGVVKNGSSAADGLVPLGLSGDGTQSFRDIAGSTLDYTYDEERAKELFEEGLAEEGLSAGDITWTLLAQNTDEHSTLAAALQQIIQNTFGVTVSVDVVDSSSYRTKRSNYEYDLMLRSWGADWDDATNFLGGYEHTEEDNAALYYSEAFNETYHEATYTLDLTERVKKLAEAERILLEDEGVTPLYYTAQYYAVSSRLTGVLRRGVIPYLDTYYAEVSE